MLRFDSLKFEHPKRINKTIQQIKNKGRRNDPGNSFYTR
nr:MAG TPA: hypothetical protein [Caudoviricetes sp.]